MVTQMAGRPHVGQRRDLRSRMAATRRLAPILIAATALAGCNEAETPERPPSPVAYVTVEPQPFSRTVSLTGEIAARHSATYAFKTSGRVTDVAVDVGTKVEAGDVLARLDPVEQEADVAAAEAAVASAKAQATQARAAFDRQKNLLDSGYTTRSSFEDAEEALSSATSAVDMAEAELGTARENLDDTVLRADASGVITSRSVDPGQVVSAAQTAFGFAEDGPRDAIFDIQEQLLIHHGKPPEIAIHLLNNPNVKTRGTVREISPLIDTTTGTVEVKVGLQDTPPEMSLGAAVVGSDTGVRVENAIVIPWAALMSTEGEPAVWVVDDKTGAARLTPITVGSYQSDIILVESGLSEGDRVVTAGSQLVRPGQILDLVAPDEPVGSVESGKDGA